jgi:mannose-6-phosphate isomerase-like protein (cupin superfamily)
VGGMAGGVMDRYFSKFGDIYALVVVAVFLVILILYFQLPEIIWKNEMKKARLFGRLRKWVADHNSKEAAISSDDSVERLTQQLISEGYSDVRVCPIPPDEDLPEHTHDEETVHVILRGGLVISDASGTASYAPGDRVKFPAGTTHVARGKGNDGKMLIGVKK